MLRRLGNRHLTMKSCAKIVDITSAANQVLSFEQVYEIARGYPGGQELHSAYRWITLDI